MRCILIAGLLLVSACEPPTAPTRTLAQCCQSVHKCYVPDPGERVCRAGYDPIWLR